MDGCRVQGGTTGMTERFPARRWVTLSFTKWGNTRKRLDWGEGEVQALVLGRLILVACETNK